MVNPTFCPNVDTPGPGASWLQLSTVDRIGLVRDAVSAQTSSFHNLIKVVDAKQDGQVIVELLEPVAAARRGTLLLDYEEFLKVSIDPGLSIWLVALGDKSSLRNLRGIEVVS